MFRVKCKDERKRRNDRLGEGGSIFPYIKNTKVFLENLPIFSENTKVFLKNTKVFLQQESVSKRNRPIPSSAVGAGSARIHKANCFRASKPRPYARNDSIIHILNSIIKCVRTHRATHTVASAYTYIRIRLHIYTYKPTRIYVIVSGSVISCTGV